MDDVVPATSQEARELDHEARRADGDAMRRASQSLDVLAKLVPTRTEIEATEIKIDRLPSAQLTADLERAQLRTSTLQAPKYKQHLL